MTSRARQLQQAAMLMAGHGVIVAEFFDVGESRTLAWARRPRRWWRSWRILTGVDGRPHDAQGVLPRQLSSGEGVPVHVIERGDH